MKQSETFSYIIEQDGKFLESIGKSETHWSENLNEAKLFDAKDYAQWKLSNDVESKKQAFLYTGDDGDNQEEFKVEKPNVVEIKITREIVSS